MKSAVTPDAFTIGNKAAYDRAAAEGATKVGRTDGYDGGAVWPTREEARRWLDERGGCISFEGRPPVPCAVYGLILPHGWDSDVDSSHYREEGFHRLINDAPIVAL
jgi:hypothetical protein